MAGQQRLIPLVERHPKGFTLSRSLKRCAGPIWSADGWELKKFVAHVVSHFEDGLEHILDLTPDDGDPLVFDVRLDFCEQFAKKYRDEFLPVQGDWYLELLRTKLIHLRLPRSLVDEAKNAYLSVFDRLAFTQGLREWLEKAEPGRTFAHETTGWADVEEWCRSLLLMQLIDDDAICHILYTRAFISPAHGLPS